MSRARHAATASSASGALVARRCSRRSSSATYWVSALLTQMLFLGIAAASLIFLSAYGGMVSLAQVALYGIAGFVARQR